MINKQNERNFTIGLDISQNPIESEKFLIIAIVAFHGGVLGVFWVLVSNLIKNNHE